MLYDACVPLSNSISEDGETFVCCGICKEDLRSVVEDDVRFCFKSETTNTMFDYDEFDLMDQIAVMADALVLSQRMKEGLANENDEKNKS